MECENLLQQKQYVLMSIFFFLLIVRSFCFFLTFIKLIAPSFTSPNFESKDKGRIMQQYVVNKLLLSHPLTLTLRQHNIPLIFEDNALFDYKCCSTGVIVACSLSLQSKCDKNRLLNRSKTLSSQFKALSVVIIVVDGDPDVQLLSFLDIDISVALKVKVVLCGGFDQASSFLKGLCNTFSSASSTHVLNFPKKVVPYQVLLQCFSEVSSILQKPDVTRIASKAKTISQFLQSTEEDLQSIPGMGEKKQRRLFSLLRAPFITLHNEIKETTIVEVPSFFISSGHQKMMDVLHRFMDVEFNEDFEIS